MLLLVDAILVGEDLRQLKDVRKSAPILALQQTTNRYYQLTTGSSRVLLRLQLVRKTTRYIFYIRENIRS